MVVATWKSMLPRPPLSLQVINMHSSITEPVGKQPDASIRGLFMKGLCRCGSEALCDLATTLKKSEGRLDYSESTIWLKRNAEIRDR